MASTDVVTVERTIPAPAQAIFDLLADPSQHPEIDGSGTVRGCREVSQRLGRGARFGMSMRMWPALRHAKRGRRVRRGRRIAWQTRRVAVVKPFGGRIWRYELEPVEGGTLVRESWDISHESPLTRPVVRMAASTTAKNMAATLERIEKLATSS